jgi:hypothetical protein
MGDLHAASDAPHGGIGPRAGTMPEQVRRISGCRSTARDAAWKRFMEEGRMKNAEMPFDGKRMIYGGFSPILEA